MVKHVSDRIWDQMKHTGGTCLRMSIVYIGLVRESSLDPLAEVDYMIRPLFRTMKCLDPYTRSAKDKCMIFVDEFGWVFQNWRAFTQETLYTAIMIVVPVSGVFLRKDDGRVKLSYIKAPKTAAEIEQERYQNIGMTVAGLGSAGVLGFAAFFPVTAPFVWGAIGVGTMVGVVTGASSVKQLFNRADHEQSIALSDKEARLHWLSVTGTVVGFAASGMASFVRSAATAGNVSKLVVYGSNTLFGSSIFINGVGVANNIWNVASEGVRPSAAEVLQLSVSLFLFTHSVYNFQTANTMVRETQAQHLSDYKTTLSKNGQKRFQNKLNGRIRQNGVAKGTGDTIRNLNTAEHYNSNFRGTDAHLATSGATNNKQLRENLARTFNRYAPESMSKLAEIHTVIVIGVGEVVFDLLKRMAELLIERMLTRGEFSIEWVLEECYTVCREYARRRNISIDDVLMSFNGLSHETIPVFVREWFRVLMAEPGEESCAECGGKKYLSG